MIIKIEVSLGIGIVGAIHRDVLEIEVSDDASQEEINTICEQEYQDWASNYIDGHWEIKN